NHELVDLPSVKIGETNIELNHEVLEGKHNYTGQYVVPASVHKEASQILLDLSLLQSIKDIAGNTASVATDDKITYHEPLIIENVHFVSDYQNQGIAVKGSEITFSFSSNRKILHLGQIRIGKNTLFINETEKDGKIYYEGHLKVLENVFPDLSVIPLDLSQIKTVSDQFGNTATIQTMDEIIYYAPIQISNVKFESDHKDPSVAINGSTLNFSFYSNHELVNLDKILIGNSELALEMKKEGDRVLYSVSQKIKEEYQDGSPVMLDYSKIKIVKDVAGQEAEIKTDDTITYYKPLSMNNVVKMEFTCTGNKVGNTYYVKNNDQISVSIECNRPLMDTDLRIGDQRIEMQSEDEYSWTGTYTFQNLQDRSLINTTLVLQDQYNTPPYHIDGAKFNACVFYSDLQINRMNFQSSNENGVGLVKNGDVLTIGFSTNHESNIKNCQIGGQSVDVVSDNRIDYTAKIEMSGALAADQEGIPFSLTLGDDANNDDVTRTQQDSTPIIYYAPIQLADLEFKTSNERDSTKYAKDGDTITTSIKSNHSVNLSGQIIGANVTAAGHDNNYTVTQKVQALDDQQRVGFSLTATDIAGNTPVTVTDSNTENQIVYFAPITADAVITSNNAKNSKYAKAGDTINGVITANHEVNTSDAQLHGFRTNVSGKGE
ncbi:MAG: hypothetical protein RR614_04985, partial [Eubacterium sp.]